MAAAAPSLHPLTSFRLFRPSSALPALQSSSSFFPPSTTHRSSPSRTPRLHSQLTPSSAAVVTEADPAAGEDGEKFDWFSQWYPVAPICDLDKRRPHAKTILGLDIVVWWDRVEGRWQVFDDRCPHRLAPLSEGRIDPGGRLQCVYHGWCFDGSGNCKYIPQAPDDGPQFHTFRKACASVYPSFEQNKILWFWPNTDPQYKSISVKKKPPYIQELDDPSYTTMEGIRDFPFGYEVLIENLMDPAHVPYAHRGIMNVPKSPNKRPDREGGLPLDIKLDTLDITGFSAHRNFGYNRFIAPCVFYSSSPPLISGNGSPSSSVVQEDSTLKSLQKQRRFLLIFMCIPVSPGRSRLIYTFPRNFAVWVNRVVPRWIIHVGQNLILDSDLYLLHVEERKFAKAGPSNWSKICFVPTKSDAMVVAFRNWLRKYSNSQINWGTAFNEQLLPPTPPREQLLDRYWTHVVQCSSCRSALKFLKALKLCLQIISFASVGIVAAIKQSTISTITRSAVVSLALLGFIASKWLSHFIYKNFYYHDYDHAFK